MLISEIFIKFNTAYYKEGIIHYNRRNIFQNYIRTELSVDIMLLLPYYFTFNLVMR
jgi:hypothetical protein